MQKIENDSKTFLPESVGGSSNCPPAHFHYHPHKEGWIKATCTLGGDDGDDLCISIARIVNAVRVIL